MFNLFRKGEPNSNNSELEKKKIEEESSAEVPEIQNLEEEKLPEPVSPEQVFSQSIQDVKEYLKLNGKIDPETIEIMTGMSLEQTLENLEKDESLKMELSVRELKEAVIEALNTIEDPARDNWLRKFVNKPAVKKIAVVLLLFLKFAPDAQGAEKKDINPIDNGNKTETSFDQNKSIDDANTYQFGEDDLERGSQAEQGDAKEISIETSDLEKFSKLEMSNYYETDSDIIPESNVAEIKSQFNNFLDKINADNFQELSETDFEIFGSSDERPTSNWEGSNEKLSEARIAAAEEILKATLAEYDFGDRLSEEQQERLRNKEFKAQMPEGGVTHLTDLINPDTGENYTAEDISTLSEEERLELLKDCRRVDVNFLAKKGVDITEMQPKSFVLDDLRIDSLKHTLTNWDKYESVALIADNSPSMDQSYAKISEIIKGQAELKNTEIKFGTFSDQLESLDKMDNLEEVVQAIKNMDRKGSHQERAIESALSALEDVKVKVGEKMKLLIVTDEPLQNLTYENLQALKAKAEQKNCEVDIIYAHKRQGGAAQILSLEELMNSYQEIVWQDLSLVAQAMIKGEEVKLNRLESTKSSLEKVIDRNLSRDNLKRSERKNVEAYQDRLANLSGGISQSRLLLDNLQAGLSEGNLASLESVIKENNSRYSDYKVDVDPSVKEIGINLDLAQSK
jgi:hypothetical protein